MNLKFLKSNFIFHFLSVLIFIAISSCNNSFVKQDQIAEIVVPDTIFMSDQFSSQTFNFNYAEAGNAKWRVFQMPAWVKTRPLEGRFENGKTTFDIINDPITRAPEYGFFDIPLVFEIEGIGLVKYPFMYMNIGAPEIIFSSNAILLGTKPAGVFSFRNNNGGIYLWEITSKPSWLFVSRINGTLNAGGEESIKISVLRENLPKGVYAGTIKMKGNSLQKEFAIQVFIQIDEPVIAGNIENISGEVTDAEFCKETGLTVFSTKNPNRLYFSDNGKALRFMELNRIPTFISISENGENLAVYCTNTEVLLIDIQSLTIIKSIETGSFASDLVLGNNGWAYLAPKQYDFTYMKSINLQNSNIITGKAWVNGLNYLKKVPGKNIMIGTRNGWSPDGLFVFDISKGAVRDTINEYHTDTWKFWILEPDDRILCGTGSIYSIPAFDIKKNYIISDKPPLKGEFEKENMPVAAADNSVASGKLHILLRNGNVSPVVFKYDIYAINGLYRIDSYIINDCKKPGTGEIIPTEDVPFMFVNKAGNRIVIIKKATLKDTDYWFLENITIK